MGDFHYGVPAAEEIPSLDEVLTQSFCFKPDLCKAWLARLGEENTRVVRDGGRVVAGLGIWRVGQWFGGKRQAMGAIAAVGVAPEARGTGVGATLMRSTLAELREEGVALSTLYASVEQLYRSVGYESAGSNYRYSVRAGHCPAGDRTMPVTRIELADYEALIPICDEFGRWNPGYFRRNAGRWGAVLNTEDSTPWIYRVGEDEGYVLFREKWEDEGYDLQVMELVALTPAALARIWTLFADHRSLGRYILFDGPPRDARLLLFPDQYWEVKHAQSWMLRVVHVPRALTERGYAEWLDEELHLEVMDDVLPENAGQFVLRVAGGGAEVTEGGRGDLVLDVRTLAPLFTGLFSAAELSRQGMLEGPTKAVAAADRMFAGPHPWMAEHF